MRRISFAMRRDPTPQVSMSTKMTTNVMRKVNGSELVTAETGVSLLPLAEEELVAAGDVEVDASV